MDTLSPGRIQPLSQRDQNAGADSKRKAPAKAVVQNSQQASPPVAEPENDEQHQLDERA